MSSTPEISIIIPAYQHARELPLCLGSIFAQTFRDFEVILVNDGSIDGTEEAVAPFRARLKYIHQENRGGNAARNRGFQEARGRFLLFCDADVIMRPGMLAKMRDALIKNPDVSYAYASFNFGWKRFTLWPFDAERLQRMNYIHTTSLIRREHFPGFDEAIRRLQDWDLWLTMLEAGHVGTWIPETLFTCLPHKGGISTWVPGWFYRVPWRKFGMSIPTIEKFAVAREIMRVKHRLPDAPYAPAGASQFGLWSARAILYYVIFELVSLYGFLIPAVSTGAFFALVTFAAWLAWRRPADALLLLLAELFVGSQGGYMVAYAGDGLFVSLRLALFLIVFGAWLSRSLLGLVRGWRTASAEEQGHVTRWNDVLQRPELNWLAALRTHGLFWPYVALLGAIGYGVLRGLALGNDFGELFFDANGYAYLALLPAFLESFTGPSGAWLRLRTGAVLLAAVVDSVLKALVVEFFFSHRQFFIAWNLYVWVRDTRVGEITIMDADFYRIFFQSQIWSLGLLMIGSLYAAYAATLRERRVRLVMTGLVFAMTAMILSLSRSFWFGGAVSAIVLGVMLIWAKASWMVWRRLLSIGSGTAIAGVVLILSIYSFPYPSKTGDLSFAGLLGSRATSLGDAAASSRWALLPKLMALGREHPVLGSGFGRTVTYKTSDPRLLKDNPTGEYTTSAFEWGYHDLWIKLGFLGLVAYGWFLWRITKPLWNLVRTGRERLARVGMEDATKTAAVLSFGALGALTALFATNVFSPYLNHPLGIGMLMLLAATPLALKDSHKNYPS